MTKSRAEAFSDGVFAVAATLLVFNLVDPKAGSGLAGQLISEWPSYAAYAISFSTIVVIWVNHHAVTDSIGRFDRRLQRGRRGHVVGRIRVRSPPGRFGPDAGCDRATNGR